MLSQGYPMDNSPALWYKVHGAKFSSVALSFGEEELLESDIADFAWKDHVTPQMRKFFEFCVDRYKKLCDYEVIMQSMHSGSSDYLKIGKIRKWLDMNP